MQTATSAAPDFVQLAAKPVLTVEDAATLSCIPSSVLYALWAAGKGPRSFKLGRRRVVSRAALAEWLGDVERSGGVSLKDCEDEAA